MFQFPNINPIAVDFGFIKISWYALSYVAGILLSWYLILQVIKIKKIEISNKIVSDLISNCMIGIIVGGRLGYVIFYNPEYYLNNLIDIFKIWNGGMSFHGGFIGVILAIIYSSKTSKIPIIIFSDLISIVSPIGLFFGRIANFINGELVGKTTTVMWGVIFPKVDMMPRHPSQLYEAFLEGIVLFFIMRTLISKKDYFIGTCSWAFLFYYGIFRIISEIFREPDSQIGYLFNSFSIGTCLSIIMILAGLITRNFLNKKNEIQF